MLRKRHVLSKKNHCDGLLKIIERQKQPCFLLVFHCLLLVFYFRTMNLLADRKANDILGCIKAAWPAGDSCPVLHSHETLPGILCPALGLSEQCRGGLVGESPEEATKMIRGLEQLSYEDKMRE